MILSRETFDKLQKELAGIDTPIKDEYFEFTNKIKLPEIANQKAYEENFRLLLNAIIQEKPIRYNNIDKKGNVYNDRLALPVSIEYSMRDGDFVCPCTCWMKTGLSWPMYYFVGYKDCR